MPVSPTDLSEAVVAYLGVGILPFPRGDASRLIQAFGAEQAAAMEAEVVSLLRELAEIEVDWSIYSLKAAGKLVADQMRAKHPELSSEAIDAFVWKFTFDWR